MCRPIRTLIGPAETLGDRPRRLERTGRCREGDKEGVALGIDLDPAVAAHASRITRRCSASASAYPSAPSSCSSFVEPSTSVKRKVTVPVGRSLRISFVELRADGGERPLVHLNGP